MGKDYSLGISCDKLIWSRLCRPMCGKALPFRMRLLIIFRTLVRLSLANVNYLTRHCFGRPEAFRTSAGVAERLVSNVGLAISNAITISI